MFGIAIIRLGAQRQIPYRAKRRRVPDVPECVEHVEPRERQILERTLLADVRDQVGQCPDDDERQRIPGHLQRRRCEAGEQREEAVKPRRLVEEERKRDELRASLQRHESEECLYERCGLATPLTNDGGLGARAGSLTWGRGSRKQAQRPLEAAVILDSESLRRRHARGDGFAAMEEKNLYFTAARRRLWSGSSATETEATSDWP